MTNTIMGTIAALTALACLIAFTITHDVYFGITAIFNWLTFAIIKNEN